MGKGRHSPIASMLMSVNNLYSLLTKSGVVSSQVPLLQRPPRHVVPSGKFREPNGWHAASLSCDLQQVLQSSSPGQKHWVRL